MNNMTGVKIDKFTPNSEQRLQCINSGCESHHPRTNIYDGNGIGRQDYRIEIHF